MDLYKIAHRIAAKAIDIVREAYKNSPKRSKRPFAPLYDMTHLRGPDITWVARRIKEGVDPEELYDKWILFWNNGGILNLSERVLSYYDSYESWLKAFDKIENLKNKGFAELSDEEILNIIPKNWYEAIRKAYFWKPKTNSDGWYDKDIIEAIKNEDKPAGEILAYMPGEYGKTGKFPTPNFIKHISDLNIEFTPMKNNDHRVFIFKKKMGI